MVHYLAYSDLDRAMPELGGPVAALLDCEDERHRGNGLLRTAVESLIEAGCVYFVSFGPRAEEVHDFIDDLLAYAGLKDIMTTFHDEETAEDVANFFVAIAMQKVREGLTLSGERNRWEGVFARIDGGEISP